MASLTLTIGTLTSTISADNQKAATLVSRYADAIGATGTSQQRLDTVLAEVVRHMQFEARRHHENAAKAAVFAAITSELQALTWE